MPVETVHSSYHRLELCLDVSLFLGSWILMSKAGCTSLKGCEIDSLPWTVRVYFGLIAACFFGALYYLTEQAKQVGEVQDAEMMWGIFKVMCAKVGLMLLISVIFGAVFPLLTSIMMLLVPLTFSDKLFNKKYWGSLVGMDSKDVIIPCEGDHTADRYEYMQLLLDVCILIAVVVVIGAKTEPHPGWTNIMLAFFFSFNIGLVIADVVLMKYSEAAGNQQDKAIMRKKLIQAVVKAIIFYALYRYLHLLACLMTGVIIAITHLPVWSAYEHSLFEKYFRGFYHSSRNLLQS